jgi:kumamolisin
MELSLVLKVPGEADLQRYLEGLYDPRSAYYRHFLNATEFGARFGLSLDRIGAVEAWAEANGLVVTARFEQRTALRVSGTIGQVGQLFGVSLGSYLDPPTGAVFHAPLGAATIPVAIAGDVDGVAGLSNEPVRSGAKPAVDQQAAAATQGFGPLDLAEAYDILPIYRAGIFGQGQTVAIVSFDTFYPSDVVAFDKQFGITGPPVQRIAVGPKITAPGEGSDEVALDIDVLRSVAPQATILNFEAVNGGNIGFADIFDAIVQDGRADIVTVSWGRCDIPQAVTVADRTRTLRSLQAATAKGVSIFVASGDWGAFTCWVWNPSDHRQSLFWPSNSPYTIAVGGTRLQVRDDGTYFDEAGWEDYLSTSGSGGGLSAGDLRPSWQVGPGVENEYSDGHRQTPDVSATADPDTGYLVYRTPSGGGTPGWTVIGGTSGAAPFWAGIMLLIRQLAVNEGVGRLGYVNPMLYALAQSNAPNTIFHDVVRGGDLFHHATPGWDFATGLGSPDVTELARAIVGYLAEHPAK